MYTLLSDKINDKLYDINHGRRSKLEEQLEKLSWVNIDLSKLDELKSTCETVRKEIKKKTVDVKVFDEAAKKIEKCIKEPEVKIVTSMDCISLLCILEKCFTDLEEKIDAEETLEKCKKIENMISEPGISEEQYFKEKFIESGILPPLPTIKEFTYEGKKIKCAVGINNYVSIINTYLSIIIAGNFSGYKVSEDEYLLQAKRLIGITTKIFENEKEKFFNFYPFTQKGEFKKIPVVIADSGIVNYENCGEYTTKSTFKLIIDSDYYYNKDDESVTYSIRFSDSNSSDKTPPIYDANNIPSRPVKVKVKYLKQEELKVGHIYIEKVDGPKYIYIGSELHSKDCTYYNYLRHSKKAENLAKECKSIDELLEKLLAEQLTREYKNDSYRKRDFSTAEEYVEYFSECTDAISGFSSRFNPRKFIADVGSITFKE